MGWPFFGGFDGRHGGWHGDGPHGGWPGGGPHGWGEGLRGLLGLREKDAHQEELARMALQAINTAAGVAQTAITQPPSQPPSYPTYAPPPLPGGQGQETPEGPPQQPAGHATAPAAPRPAPPAHASNSHVLTECSPPSQEIKHYAELVATVATNETDRKAAEAASKDGKFTAGLEKAVEDFQRDNKEKYHLQYVDGKIGVGDGMETGKALERALREKNATGHEQQPLNPSDRQTERQTTTKPVQPAVLRLDGDVPPGSSPAHPVPTPSTASKSAGIEI